MDNTLILVATAFAAIVIGVGVYKHYKKKARLLAKKLEEANGETPAVEAPVSTGKGGGSGKNTGVAQQAK